MTLANPTTIPVHELIARRRSPRAFADRRVTADQLKILFEAARWAPSSSNRQPWRFILATKDDPENFNRMLDLLKEGNRTWAQDAPVLVLAVAEVQHELGRNSYAWHDLGLASAHLTLQATALDLYVHTMGGFYKDQAREAFNIPAEYEPVTVLAIGYLGEAEQLPEHLRERENALRMRKPLDELVFSRAWREPATIIQN